MHAILNRQFTHDPARYRDPLKFKPERFLGENPEPDTHDISFGFGRRYVWRDAFPTRQTYCDVIQNLPRKGAGRRDLIRFYCAEPRGFQYRKGEGLEWE